MIIIDVLRVLVIFVVGLTIIALICIAFTPLILILLIVIGAFIF